MSKKWTPLEPGDSIAVIAPGMPFEWAQFKAAERIIHEWGYRLSYPKNILGKATICSQSRERREEFLREALVSDAKVIWGARGGFGSLHLTRGLEKLKPRSPKLLIGFSDLVTLHQVFQQQWDWPSLHGPHIDRLAALNSNRLKELRQVLAGEKVEIVFPRLKAMNRAAQKTQNIIAPIVGGNMVTLQSTIGTALQLPTKNKILFFEEIGERGYKIDRLLEHFSNVNFFKNAKAVVFGPFTGGNEQDGSNRIVRVLADFAQLQKIPVFQGLYSGHVPNSLSLPLNTRAHLSVKSGKASLVVDTGATL